MDRRKQQEMKKTLNPRMKRPAAQTRKTKQTEKSTPKKKRGAAKAKASPKPKVKASPKKAATPKAKAKGGRKAKEQVKEKKAKGDGEKKTQKRESKKRKTTQDEKGGEDSNTDDFPNTFARRYQPKKSSSRLWWRSLATAFREIIRDDVKNPSTLEDPFWKFVTQKWNELSADEQNDQPLEDLANLWAKQYLNEVKAWTSHRWLFGIQWFELTSGLIGVSILASVLPL